MSQEAEKDKINRQIAERWCVARGSAWSIDGQAGRGGTAPVFAVRGPEGELALKIYDAEFSDGEKGKVEEKRVAQQVELGRHDCPSLIQVYDGGKFEGRLFLLMNRAPGAELEKRLRDIPRSKIRGIVDQIARACLFLRERDLCHRDIKSANVFVSNDYETATLLDLSVTRDIYDPVGIGTDHDGQLPIVATARYSPPEYLFRLLEPGPVLWHALDVYQLGALLHDMIMREPLFQQEYMRSKENRYRFAWSVATMDPVVHALDVDQDLVFTARRALDKDWERRSLLSLSDFLSDPESQKNRAMDALGLSSKQNARPDVGGYAASIARVAEVASALRARIQEFLRREGVIPRHDIKPGGDDKTKLVQFIWSPAEATLVSGDVIYSITLRLAEAASGSRFLSSVRLSSIINGDQCEEEIDLPSVEDSAGASDRIGEDVESALPVLAKRLLKVSR